MYRGQGAEGLAPGGQAVLDARRGSRRSDARTRPSAEAEELLFSTSARFRDSARSSSENRWTRRARTAGTGSVASTVLRRSRAPAAIPSAGLRVTADAHLRFCLPWGRTGHVPTIAPSLGACHAPTFIIHLSIFEGRQRAGRGPIIIVVRRDAVVPRRGSRSSRSTPRFAKGYRTLSIATREVRVEGVSESADATWSSSDLRVVSGSPARCGSVPARRWAHHHLDIKS